MSRFVRSSKFRHVFGTAPKKDICYDNIKISKSPHESNMCAVNSKFVAVVLDVQGGGAFLVAPRSSTGRFDINYPKVSGHKNPVLDIAWNPFDDNQIASASEDCTIKLWNIPDKGLSSNMDENDIVCDLVHHQRKVQYVVWHPCASNVLLSTSADNTVIIWNTLTVEAVIILKDFHPDMIHSVSWSYNGALIATSCKDKKLRVIDPRESVLRAEGKSHEGTKPSKVVFCGKTNLLWSTGFSRMSDRQYALWDPEDLSKSIKMENIDTSSGVLFPFWDEGTGMVYLAGKGDTQIRYFEFDTAKSPFVYFLSMYQPTTQQRSVAAMPKREVDYLKCEVMRFYRVNPKGVIEPTSMTVPRKSDMFQEDIYPPCPAGKAALTAEEWFGGVDKDPLLVRFTAGGLKDMSAAECQVSTKLFDQASKIKKDPSVLKRFGSPQPEGGKAMPVTLEEYRKAYKELQEENLALKEKLAKLE